VRSLSGLIKYLLQRGKNHRRGGWDG
jgi:hypothetical protein